MSGSDTPSRRERVVRYGVDQSLSRERAAARISAYLYGNIIAFAALVPLSAEEVEHGHALELVLGVAVSTYLAHVFSEIVGHQVRAGESMTRAEIWHEMVDSRPIASSAVVPCILIVAAMLDWLSGDAAVYAAEAYVLVRLALVGFIVERLRSDRLSLRTLLAGVGLAAVAFGISVLKAALGH